MGVGDGRVMWGGGWEGVKVGKGVGITTNGTERGRRNVDVEGGGCNYNIRGY